MPTPRNLDALFGPKNSRKFQTFDWPTSPVIQHGPLKRLPVALRSGDLSSFERLASSIEVDAGARGVSVAGSGFRGDVLFASRRGDQVAHRMRAASPARLLQAGLNIMFEDFRLPSLEPWLEQLANEVGIPPQAVRLYAFAAPDSDGNGADPHWDPNETIHVQLHGKKTFRLAPNAHVVNPDMFTVPYDEELVGEFHDRVPKQVPTVWQEVQLRPGSVVYFPRGYWHETSTEGLSFGVALTFRWPTAADVVLEQLRFRLRQDLDWRTPLFGMHMGRGAVRHYEQHLASLIQELGLPADQYPSNEALARLLPLKQRVSVRGRDGRYVSLPFTLSRRRQKDGSYSIRIRTRSRGFLEMEASAPFVDAIAWIAGQSSFTLRDLAHRFPALGRTHLERLLIVLLENAAIQFDPRETKPAPLRPQATGRPEPRTRRRSRPRAAGQA